MSRLHSFVLAQFRSLFSSRTRGIRNRNRRQKSAAMGRDLELLEQRQLLVQPPVSLAITGGVGSTPFAIQWVQPSTVRNFDVTISRTDLVSGGPQVVIMETGIAPTATLAIPTETYRVNQPLAAGTYTVSVTARGTDNSVASSSANFTVGQSAPQMLSVSGKQFSSNPADRPQVPRSVSLAWTVLPGVNDYYLWIARKTAGSYVQISSTTPQSLKGGVYDVSLEAGEYQARVRDLNNPTDWSNLVDFEVVGSQSQVPVFSSTPATLSQGGSLSWAPVPLAAKYQVSITGPANTSTTVADAEYRGAFLAAGTYTAKVRAADSDGRYWGWSTDLVFTISGTSYTPTLTSTPSGSQVNGVTPIIWNPVGWATAYEVTLQNTAGTVISKEQVQGTRFNVPVVPPSTNYRVIVKALDSGAGSQSVQTADFLVTSTTFKPSPPVITQSVNGTVVSWSPISGALSYDVWIDRLALNGYTAQPQVVRDVTFGQSLALDSRIQDGPTYRVWVQPRFANNVAGPAWSNATDFSVTRTQSFVIRTDSASDPRQPRFEWTEFPDAVAYKFQLINKSVSPPVNVIPPVTGLTRPSFQVPLALPAATYYAYVEVTLPSNQILTVQSPDFVVASPATASAPSNVIVSRQSDGIAIQWASGQTGMHDVRVASVNWSGATEEVIREQSNVTATGPFTHLIRGGMAPGLYRVDVGVRPTPGASPVWAQGPIFRFDGNVVSSLTALGATVTSGAANVTGPFKGDFDGDGDLDLVKRNSTTGQLTVRRNNATSLSTETWNANGSNPFVDPVVSGVNTSLLVGDFNGDGRDDLLQPNPDSSIWTVMRTRPSGTFEKVETPVTGRANPDLPDFSWNVSTGVLTWNKVKSPNETGNRNYEIQIVRNGLAGTPSSIALALNRSDTINGLETISENLTSLGNGEYTVFVRTSLNGRVSQWSDGYGIRIGGTTVGTTSWWNYLVGDFNGDRRDDIAVFNTVRRQWNVYTSTGTSFEQAVWTDGIELAGNYIRPVVIDVNGDGRKDIVIQDFNNGSWSAQISTGTSFVTQTLSTPAFMQDSTLGFVPMASDVDADGREDIVIWHGSNLRVLFSRTGALSEIAGGATWTPVPGMPGNSVPVDMNDDGRADLVGFDAAGKSIVALASATTFGNPTIWQLNSNTSWVTPLSDTNVTVADFDYRSKSIRDVFDRVRNTVAYEGYRGLKKGATATDTTKSGNAWDQANLVGELLTGLAIPITSVQYVTGRIRISEAQAKEWIGTANVPTAWFSAAGLNPALSGGELEVDHAWLQAWGPTAAGLGWITLNPSFKATLVSAPSAASNLFTVNDLDTYLTPTTSTFSADFDSLNPVTSHNSTTLPQQLVFLAGSGTVVSKPQPQWPIGDYKLATARGTQTRVAFSDEAIDAEVSTTIVSEVANGSSQHNFSVFARATADYEVGFELSPGAV